MSDPRATLLARAARNYQLAGQPEPAARCFLDAGEPAHAAPLLVGLGRAREAALAWERAGDHGSAARCWEDQGELDAAARAWVAANQPLRAAWIYAHQLAAPARALALLDGIPEGGPELAAEVAFLRARALGRLTAVLTVAEDIAAGRREGGLRLVDRALAFAEAEGRLDLIATLHAAMAAAGAQPRVWQRWANDRLHDPTGVPLPAAPPQEPG